MTLLATAASALTLSLTTPSTNAGILSILKGSDEPERPPQRVAFVGSAQVKQCDGSALRLAGIDKWEPLKPGAILSPGDLVRSESGSVTLQMAETHSLVRLTPHTTLRLLDVDQAQDRTAFSGEEPKGFAVRSCRGPATYRAGLTEWRPVTVNSVLAEGTLVRTAPGTVLDVFSTEEKRPLRITGSSEVKLTTSALVTRVVTPPTFAAAGR